MADNAKEQPCFESSVNLDILDLAASDSFDVDMAPDLPERSSSPCHGTPQESHSDHVDRRIRFSAAERPPSPIGRVLDVGSGSLKDGFPPCTQLDPDGFPGFPRCTQLDLVPPPLPVHGFGLEVAFEPKDGVGPNDWRLNSDGFPDGFELEDGFGPRGDESRRRFYGSGQANQRFEDPDIRVTFSNGPKGDVASGSPGHRNQHDHPPDDLEHKLDPGPLERPSSTIEHQIGVGVRRKERALRIGSHLNLAPSGSFKVDMAHDLLRRSSSPCHGPPQEPHSDHAGCRIRFDAAERPPSPIGHVLDLGSGLPKDCAPTCTPRNPDGFPEGRHSIIAEETHQESADSNDLGMPAGFSRSDEGPSLAQQKINAARDSLPHLGLAGSKGQDESLSQWNYSATPDQLGPGWCVQLGPGWSQGPAENPGMSLGPGWSQGPADDPVSLLGPGWSQGTAENPGMHPVPQIGPGWSQGQMSSELLRPGWTLSPGPIAQRGEIPLRSPSPDPIKSLQPQPKVTKRRRCLHPHK